MKHKFFIILLKFYGNICTIGGLAFLFWSIFSLESNVITEIDCIFRSVGSILISLSGAIILNIVYHD